MAADGITDDPAYEFHLMLLGLAGRIDDSVLARCRGLLADQRTVEVPDELLDAILDQGVPLFGPEVEFFAEAMGWTAHAAERLSAVTITEVGVPLRYQFAEPTAVHGTDAEDRVVIETTARHQGTRGLWRSGRVPARNPMSPRIARVYVVEADEHANLVAITGDIQRGLAAIGPAAPRIEVYPTGFGPPVYQRLARAYGTLLWAREPDPGVRVATLFDEIDPPLGPRFRPDHPRCDEAEWSKLVNYLRKGNALLLTDRRLDDVVDRSRGRSVPTSYRTDGRWVWSEAATYYLEVHRLLPDPLLVKHIRARKHTVPVVGDVGMHRAMQALRASAD